MEKNMQNLSNSQPKDEVDLRELFMALWAYKFLIAVTCILSIVCAGYIVLNTDKKFTSVAIFKLDNGNSNGVSINGQLGAIASLAGFNSGQGSGDLPTDLVKGRVFIEKLDAKLDFHSDAYFNSYNPNSVDPIWKSTIKRAIGWQKPSTSTQDVIWQGIVNTYSNNVVLEETLDGSIQILVTHVSPLRAAEIANGIMNEIISNTKNKRDSFQDQQLNYLSNTLAESLRDLDISQSKLKEFALENNVLPLETFTAASAQLDSLREQLNRTSELHEAVAALSLMLKNKTINQSNYFELRHKFPIIDQVEFRRVLGQNEIISSWSWPETTSVEAIFDTLSERKDRLEAQINATQIDAERLGLVVESYAKLERNATIAEATYTVLIEQVKAQSMLAGYRPEKTEIYEYATPSMSSTSPNRNMILALGATLGLLLGVSLSYILALQRGVYFSKTSLKTGSQARLTASIKSLLPLRNKSLTNINSILINRPNSILRDLAVAINKHAVTEIVVTSSRTKMRSKDVARALSSYMQSDTMKIAIIDFSSRDKKIDVDDESLSVGTFIITERLGHLSILMPDSELEAIEMLSQRDFWRNTQTLNSTFDLIFLCADNTNAISLLTALEGKKVHHITLARTKRTKSATMNQMRSLLPIQGLLHD